MGWLKIVFNSCFGLGRRLSHDMTLPILFYSQSHVLTRIHILVGPTFTAEFFSYTRLNMRLCLGQSKYVPLKPTTNIYEPRTNCHCCLSLVVDNVQFYIAKHNMTNINSNIIEHSCIKLSYCCKSIQNGLLHSNNLAFSMFRSA